MTTDTNDIVKAVKAAEAEAAETVRLATEDKRTALADAEARSAANLSEGRAKAGAQYETGIARAEAEALEITKKAEADALLHAEAAGKVPSELLEQAVTRLVKALYREWQ